MRSFMTLVLLAVVLCVAGNAGSDARREGEAIFLSTAAASWELKIPARGLQLKDEQRRDNGVAFYYLFENPETGLLFSVYLEPAVSCKTSLECRDRVWDQPNPLIQDPVDVKRFEEGGFAVVQYTVPRIQGVKVDQLNFSAQIVRDGTWADVHLSKGGARKADKALLRDVLRSVSIIEKPRRVAGTRNSERRFPIPGQGAIVMTVPPAWTDRVPRESEELSSTIIFTPEIGSAFKVMVTPLWPKKNNDPLPSDREIKANVERSIASVRGQAMESSIPVRHLRQGSVQGYYFAATDRAPKAGEFKFLTQGTVVCGRLVVAFTVLSNDGSGKVEKDAVTMIGSMRHVQ